MSNMAANFPKRRYSVAVSRSNGVNLSDESDRNRRRSMTFGILSYSEQKEDGLLKPAFVVDEV